MHPQARLLEDHPVLPAESVAGGCALSAERAALSSAQVLLIRIVSGLGTTAIAANSLGVSAESLCYMAGYGIQDASLAW